MASDWVGIAGTAIGAAIGGLVTMASLSIKGRQDAIARREAAEREDRRRAEDRMWQIRRQNVEQRREVYAKLLRYATAFQEQMGFVHAYATDDFDIEDLEDALDKGDSLLEQFGDAAAEVDVICFDARIAEMARSFVEAASDFLLAIRVGAVPRYQPRVDEVSALVSDLRVACRKDVDHGTSSTP